MITHGTDTVEETGYFLQLTVKSPRPMVLTGAIPPATSLSADGPLNLYNAVAVAADPHASARGVIVVINDDLHSARDVTKANTTEVHALGLIAADELNPQKARILLQLCLAHDFDRARTQEAFYTY